MLQINNYRKVLTDIPIITSDYYVLLEADEPVLFTGMNKYGNRVLGSLIEHDFELRVSRYFHILLGTRDYLRFIDRKIPFRTLLENANDIFVVDLDFGNNIHSIYNLLFNEIPEEYLPLEHSYCPKINNKYSLDYIVKLSGKLADYNLAVVSEVNQIQTSFANFFAKSFKLLKDIKATPIVYAKPATIGSFKLNYSIQLEKDIFPAEINLSRFITTYLEFCIKYLPDQVSTIFSESLPQSVEYNLLKEEVSRLYNSAALEIPESMDELIKNEIINGASTINEISEAIGNNFNEIELLNEIDSSEVPIGIIDLDSKEKIRDTIEVIESKSPLLAEDSDYKEYEIFIYNLNIDSRSGNALIFRNESEFDKPRIKISGENHLDNTKYTESLYRNIKIKVLAKAKKYNERFRSLDICFEDN